MPISFHFGTEAIFGFLFTVTRVGSALFLFPLPGFKDVASPAKIVLVVGICLCLYPFWPAVQISSLSGGEMLLGILGESAAGMLIGLAIAFLHEAFQLAAQAASVQSGFSFASIFDPSSKADTGVFLMLTQLTTGMLFFIFGVYQQLLRLLAGSYDVFSFQTSHFASISAKLVLTLGTTMFVTGLKLGLPLVVLLMLVEFSLALLSRLHSQLHLMMLSFPAKTVLTMVFLGAIIARWPGLYEQLAHHVLDLLSGFSVH